MVTISTPSGRLRCSSASRAFTAAMVFEAFSPQRMTTTAPTTSPSPLSSAMPRRICGPMRNSAMSDSTTGVPLASTPSGTSARSSRPSRYPVARTMYSASPISMTEPPASWLPDWIARFTMASVMPKARSLSGSTTTWYCRTMPPIVATSATPGTVCSSYFRNQSCRLRNCDRSCCPVRSTSAYS